MLIKIGMILIEIFIILGWGVIFVDFNIIEILVFK